MQCQQYRCVTQPSNLLGIHQRSDVSNDGDALLDLFYSHLPWNVSGSQDPIVYVDIYHPALNIDLTLPSNVVASQFIPTPNYFKSNIAQLRADINNLNLAMERHDYEYNVCKALGGGSYNSYITHVDILVSSNPKIFCTVMSRILGQAILTLLE